MAPPSIAEIEPKPHLSVDNVAELKAAVRDRPKKVKGLPSLSVEGSLGPLRYPQYVPVEGIDQIQPRPPPFEHVDAGSRADPDLPHLLTPDTKIKHLSPYLGTEIRGVQLSQLTKEGLDELSLYMSHRKLLILRDQDFADISIERQKEIARHFGPLHVHPTSTQIAGHEEYIASLRGGGIEVTRQEYLIEGKLSYTLWHSDVSFETQPPCATIFWTLDKPDFGGDTLFLSQVEAYNRLSPAFKAIIDKMKVIHGSAVLNDAARKYGGIIRREAIETEHPLVRVHPTTGEKALFVNPFFTTRIVGLKKEESDAILGFLYDHMSKGADFQVRATYEKGTVVIWDDRMTAHSIAWDYGKEQRRHFLKLTAQGEIPIPVAP